MKATIVLPLILAAFLQPAAGQTAPSCVVRWPLANNVALPTWLGRPAAKMEATFATVDVPVFPVQGTGNLLVTLYFDEADLGFLRVYWKSGETAERLAGNLSEGIGLRNQRSLLLGRDILAGPGLLTIQSGSEQNRLLALRFEWVEPRTVLAGRETRLPVLLPGAGTPLSEADLQPDKAFLAADEWRGRIITAPLTEKPERIEEGAVFTAMLESPSERARLEVLVSGLPLSESWEVRVNGETAGILQVEVPDLLDAAYQRDDAKEDTYGGWRRGTLFLPSGLTLGENQIEFWSKGANGPGFDYPAAIKDLKLQLQFPPPPKNEPPLTGPVKP
jgi:hypothetical protein